MFFSRKRQEKRPRRQDRQPLTLEALEDRSLLNAAPATVLDLNGLSVDQSKYSTNDILVRFSETPGKPGGPAIVQGTTLGSALPLATGFYQIELGKSMTVAKAVTAYKVEKGVLTAEPDYELKVSSVANDPLLNQQWALSNSGQSGGTPGADIHAEQAWSVANSSPNLVVAVLDTGIDYNHQDLYGNVWLNQADIPNYWYTKTNQWSGYDKIVYKWQIHTATPGIITLRDLNNPVNKGLIWHSDGNSYIDAGDLLRPLNQGGWEQSGKANDLIGWNFVGNNNNPLDDNGHGTNVAGILGAMGNSGVGVSGVDWNVQIMPVKFIGSDGYGSISNFVQALNYAVQHGAKITNNSWEGAPYSSALYDAFRNAQQKGVICVAAAGNESSNNDYSSNYPASFSQNLSNVVAVAATDNTDHLASFSNYGSHSVALAAPGVNILSTLPGNKYGYMSGTSMAAPEVAGTLALVWGLHPNWSYTQVINQVVNSTDKVAALQGRVSSGGRLDAAAAVGWNLSTQTTPTISWVSPQGPNSSSMDHIVLGFNEAIDVSSFSSWAVHLTNPYGGNIPVSVQVVSNSGDRQIVLWFAKQTMTGNYHLSISSSVRDLMGSAMKPYQATLSISNPQTYTNSTSTYIKPWGLTMSSISLPNGVVGNLNVGLNVNYPKDGSLYIYLISPSGKTIALDYQRGGWGANLTNTVFSDQANTPVANAKAPFWGTFRPDQSLSQLNGTQAGGSWRLAIYNYGGQGGTLRNWSLTLAPTVTVSSSGSTGSNSSAASSGHASTQTYSNGTSESIKPQSLAVSSVTVPPGFNVGNVEVRVNVSYPYDRDLYIYLIAPTGKTIALDYNRGGWYANLDNTDFSQQSKTPIAKGNAPFDGSYQPEQSLDQLKGSKAGGTWRLAIRNYGKSYGTLKNWSLILTPEG